MDKLEEAKEAISTLFGDTSVAKSVTLDQLKDLDEYIHEMIDALESDSDADVEGGSEDDEEK